MIVEELDRFIKVLPFLLFKIMPMMTFLIAFNVIFGGFFAWLINKILSPQFSILLTDGKPLWTETLSTKPIKTYIPSKLNPRETTHAFKLVTAIYCGLLGVIPPAITMVIYLIT